MIKGVVNQSYHCIYYLSYVLLGISPQLGIRRPLAGHIVEINKVIKTKVCC